MPGNWRKGVGCVVESQFREDHIRGAENKGKCKVMWGQGEEWICFNICAVPYSSHQSHAATETKEVNFQFYVFNFK